MAGKNRPHSGLKSKGNVGIFMKDRYETWKQGIIRRLPLMVFVYCLCQPVLDVATYWQEQMGITNAFTVIFRMGLLCGSVGLGFVLSDRKRLYWLTGLVLGGYLAGHIWSCMQAGYVSPFGDLSNMLRIMMLPLTTVCFVTFIRRNEKCVRPVIGGMAVNMGVILLVMLLSRLTGTDPYTYPNKGLGVRGWFYVTSVQSAILAMLAPVAIGWSLTKWKGRAVPVLLVAAGSLGGLYLYGTRLAYVSAVVIGIGMAVCLLLIDRKRWRQSLTLAMAAVLIAVLLPVSPMLRNQKAVAGNFERKQAAFDAVAAAPDGADEQQRMDALADAYRLFVPGLMDRFGAERTLQAFHYSQDVDVVGNNRTAKLKFCDLLMEDSPDSAKWFGINRSRMAQEALHTDVLSGKQEKTLTWYDPENDFHGIYYLCGGVGLGLMIAFIAYFALRALGSMCVDFKRVFSVDFAAVGISCCCAVVHCYFSASILRFNSASVYLAMLLAVMWFLSNTGRTPRKTAPDGDKIQIS